MADETGKKVRNVDSVGLYRTFDSYVQALQESNSAQSNNVTDAELKRFKNWGLDMRARITNASKRPAWDVVNIDPKKFLLEPPTAVVHLENDNVNQLVGIVSTMRDMTASCDSILDRSGIQPADADRLIQGCDKYDTFIAEVIEQAQFRDIPGSMDLVPPALEQEGPVIA